MEEIVKQRVLDFINSTGLSILAFSKEIGIPQTTLNQQLKGRSNKTNTTVSINTVALILKAYPTLSAEWIMRGTDPMMIQHDDTADFAETIIDSNERRILLRQIDNLNDQIDDLKLQIAQLKKASVA